MVPAMFLCILFGMLSQLTNVEWASYIFLVMAHFSIAYCFVIAVFFRNTVSTTEKHLSSHKDNLWPEFFAIMLPFPTIYSLGLAQVLTNDQMLIALSAANIVVKYLFSSRFFSIIVFLLKIISLDSFVNFF